MSLTERDVIVRRQPKQDEYYFKWNPSTALCYHNKLRCENCSNRFICNSYNYAYNEYKIKPIKYATIKTYQNIGEGTGENAFSHYTWYL